MNLQKWLYIGMISSALSLTGCEDFHADITFFSGVELIEEGGTCSNALSSVVLYENGRTAANIGMAYGKGSYQAITSDAEVVKVKIEGERLLLASGGKQGKAVVTVNDEKGNQADLSVTVGVGSRVWTATGISGVKAMENNQVIDDTLLQSAVSEKMGNYQLLEKGGQFILIPDSIDKPLTDESGRKETLWVDSDGSGKLLKGTYVFSFDEALTGVPSPSWLMEYQGETHRLYVPKIDKTREVAPYSVSWCEDITADCPADLKARLPEGSKVVYRLEMQLIPAISFVGTAE